MRRVSWFVAAVAVSAATALTGCSVTTSNGSHGSSLDAAARHDSPTTTTPSTSAPATAQAPELTPKPTAEVVTGKSGDVPWEGPAILTAAHGRIVSASVVEKGHSDDKVEGNLVNDGSTWKSKGRLYPSSTYVATLQLTGPGGDQTRTVKFTTSKPDDTLTIHAMPGPGAVVGVGQPIIVEFNRAVPDKAKVEKAMSVTTSSGKVTGAWHWFSDSVVHYRPKAYWPANSEVKIEIDLNRLYAGDGVWGDRMHDWSFRTGDSHVSYVDADRDTFRYTVNGKTVGVWPTSLGQKGFETRNGTYIVLAKDKLVQMDSCSVGISCDKGSANYYDLPVHWATRVTWSGTFVHAAPWDSQLGETNTSHGCIHLSTEHGKYFFDHAQPGDIVKVTGSPKPPSDDAGMIDWNMSWSEWLAGSALH